MATECHQFGGNTQPSILSVRDVAIPQSLPEIGLVKGNHPNLRTGSSPKCGPGAVLIGLGAFTSKPPSLHLEPFFQRPTTNCHLLRS